MGSWNRIIRVQSVQCLLRKIPLEKILMPAENADKDKWSASLEFPTNFWAMELMEII